MSLTNKVFIVTGASSGIGASLTLEALKLGANVAAVGRNKAKLDQMVKVCEKQAGTKPFVVVADVSKEDQAAGIITKTIKEFGKINVLVNNAGFATKVSITESNALQDFDYVLGTNLRAAVHLTHLAIPYLEKTKGNIVNISSTLAVKPLAEWFSYCTAKAGLDHFSRCMAVALAPKGIRVNVINPGPVQTDFLENVGVPATDLPAVTDAVAQQTLLKRWSSPVEIADLILFLTSDKAVGITGSNYVADNGFLVA